MGTEYFQLHPVIGILSNLPVLLGTGLLLLLLSRRFRDELVRRPALWLVSVFVASRLGFLLLIVFGLGHVSLDLGVFFRGQGEAVAHGLLPYRDFASSYAPLFPYLLALPVALSGGAAAISGFFILCDLVAAAAVHTAARNEKHLAASFATWAYVAAPVTWYFLVRYGQDESLAAAFLAVAYYWARRGREPLAGICLGLGFAATKFTFGIFIPPFLIGAKRPRALFLALSLTTTVVFLPFLLLDAPVWRPLLDESGARYGPGLWRLPTLFASLHVGWQFHVLLLGGLASVWLWAIRSRPRPSLERQILLTGLVFMVLSPKVMPMYIAVFWPFACFYIAHGALEGEASRARFAKNVWLAGALNLFLGTWWYWDAGGIQGTFGPVVRAISILVTAACPVITAWLAVRVAVARPAGAR